MSHTRREFLRSLVRDLVVTFENIHGHENIPLDQLDQLPDTVLGKMIPCRQTGVTILQIDGVLHAQCTGRERPVSLFATDTEEAQILERFNGQLPIYMIAEDLAGLHCTEKEVTFRQVRSLFLRLAKAGLYVPFQI